MVPAPVSEYSFLSVLQEAEVGDEPVPEPFDVRTEQGLEAGALPLIDVTGLDTSQDSGGSSGMQTCS